MLFADGSLGGPTYQSNFSSDEQTTQYGNSASQYPPTQQYQTTSQPSPVEQSLQQQAADSTDTHYEHTTPHTHSSYGTQQHTALDSTYTTESYGQSLMTQSGAQHSFVDPTSTLAGQISMEQSLGMTTADSGPQPIPLPSQVLPGQSLTYSGADGSATYESSQGYSSATESSQSYVTATDNSQTSQSTSDSSEVSAIYVTVWVTPQRWAQHQATSNSENIASFIFQQEKKPFLNPNADLFQPAAYTQSGVDRSQQDPSYTQGGTGGATSHDAKAYNQAAAGYNQATDYQAGNYSGFEGETTTVGYFVLKVLCVSLTWSLHRIQFAFVQVPVTSTVVQAMVPQVMVPETRSLVWRVLAVATGMPVEAAVLGTEDLVQALASSTMVTNSNSGEIEAICLTIAVVTEEVIIMELTGVVAVVLEVVEVSRLYYTTLLWLAVFVLEQSVKES